MLRFLLFLIILYVVWTAVKSYFGSHRSKSQKSAPGVAKGEEMVLDPQCQSYVPKAAAVLQAGKYFCSQECARLYLAR